MQSLSRHYAVGELRKRIEAALSRLDASQGPISIETLSAVDEFHIGGRRATEHLLSSLPLQRSDHVLDLGSGLGGAARFFASRVGCRVTGVDLTQEYVEVANWLSELVHLSNKVNFECGSILDLANKYGPNTFDAVTMLHVGMNIEDKARLFGRVSQVLRPGGTFGIYDVVKNMEVVELKYPLPWASSAEDCKIASKEQYLCHLESAGFFVAKVEDRADAARELFDRKRSQKTAMNEQGKEPPLLGLNLVMGSDTKQKMSNLVSSLQVGMISPTEIISYLPPQPSM